MSLADQRELHARAVALANTAGLFATNTALLRRRDARARAVQVSKLGGVAVCNQRAR